MIDSEHPDDGDRGAILLLVLAVAIVLSLVVLALANFVAADLRYSQVIDARAKTLSSAESGIDYAVDRLRLNQTLCATDAAASGEVSLNGTSPVGTVLPTALNGTDTKVTCERLDDDIADVAGWAIVIANYGEFPPSDQIRIASDGPNHVHVDGPVFLADPTRTDTSGSEIQIVDGDLWYTDGDCDPLPYSNTALAAQDIEIIQVSARGGICTTEDSGPLFSVPDIQDGLPTNVIADTTPTNGLADGDDTGPNCRVFSPGRYDLVPDFTGATDVYFKSGDYHFNFDNEWPINGVDVWAGYPDPLSVGSLGPCYDAAEADRTQVGGFYGGRPGATFYFDGESRVWLASGASLEIFPREQNTHVVSVHALPTSWTVSDSGYRSLLRTLPGSGAELFIHGLVWAPRGRINIDNATTGADQRLLGGVVLQTMWLLHLDHDSFEIRPATSTVDTRIRLASTSTTADGVSTTVEAVVEYRPHAADLDDRVAVSSFRVVD